MGGATASLQWRGEPRFGPRAQPISRGLLSSTDIFLLLPSNPAAVCVELGWLQEWQRRLLGELGASSPTWVRLGAPSCPRGSSVYWR